jgi:hypothetical protein
MAIYNEDGTCQCGQCTYEEARDALLAKRAKDIIILRTALQELVDRRERAVAQSVWGGTNDGTDGRYKRAREALDATK